MAGSSPALISRYTVIVDTRISCATSATVMKCRRSSSWLTGWPLLRLRNRTYCFDRRTQMRTQKKLSHSRDVREFMRSLLQKQAAVTDSSARAQFDGPCHGCRDDSIDKSDEVLVSEYG